MTKILIVDDEIMIREVVKEYGEVYNYEVSEAGNGLDALKMIEENDFACIILDIMMPEMDGYTTCKKIKQLTDAPVIMLSARSEEFDKLYGFELGIDDYVTKPFSPKELMARINVVIERNRRHSTSISTEHIVIDTQSHIVMVDNEKIKLTNKEFDLLQYFLENKNIVIKRELLLDKVWGFDNESNERTIDTHIKMLRKHLGKYGDSIKTVRGIGYKFEEE